MNEQLTRIYQQFKREFAVYQAVARDERVPLRSKILLGVAIGYFVSPIDLVPDFVPILGQLDDLLIVPGLIMLALRSIPPEVIVEHRARIEAHQ